MKEREYVNVPQDTIDVWKCSECPKFEYENGKSMCYELDAEVEDDRFISEDCPYRNKKKKRSKRK